MDLTINYPYGIPFFSDINFITVYFHNDTKNLFMIYFVKDKQIENLAGIVFGGEKKKYHFPENAFVGIILENKPNNVQSYIRLQNEWTYTYP